VDERRACVERYRAWVTAREDLTEQLAAIAYASCDGQLPLGCWCAPAPCHADVLVELLNDPAAVTALRLPPLGTLPVALVARCLHVQVETVHRWVDDGTLDGDRRFITLESFDRLIARQRQARDQMRAEQRARDDDPRYQPLTKHGLIL
jgi:hypothetical protein